MSLRLLGAGRWLEGVALLPDRLLLHGMIVPWRDNGRTERRARTVTYAHGVQHYETAAGVRAVAYRI